MNSYSKKVIQKLLGFTPRFKGILSDLRLDHNIEIPKEAIERKVYVKNSTYSETEQIFNSESYFLNPELINEMYLWYKFRNEYLHGKDYHTFDINKIKLKLASIHDKDLRKTRLIKELKKYQKDLTENPIALLYINKNEHLDTDIDEFIVFMKEDLSMDYDLINNYLTTKIPNLEEDVLFDSNNDYEDIYSNNLLNWHYLIKTKKTIDFINEELNDSNKTVATKLTLNQQILLLEKIRGFEISYWENLHNTKKANLLSKLLGKNSENIRKKLHSLEKPKSKLTQQEKKDISQVDDLIKTLLG